MVSKALLIEGTTYIGQVDQHVQDTDCENSGDCGRLELSPWIVNLAQNLLRSV